MRAPYGTGYSIRFYNGSKKKNVSGKDIYEVKINRTIRGFWIHPRCRCRSVLRLPVVISVSGWCDYKVKAYQDSERWTQFPDHHSVARAQSPIRQRPAARPAHQTNYITDKVDHTHIFALGIQCLCSSFLSSGSIRESIKIHVTEHVGR